MLIDITKGAEHIYLLCGYTDGRKQIEGLCALVQMQFRLNAYTPTSVFLFCNKRRNTIKALRFEEDGFLLATKRLIDEMKFQWPRRANEVKDITAQQVRWLLEGLTVEQRTAIKPVKLQERKICY